MTEETKIQATLDLNKMFEVYNKADFMRDVLVKTLKENPKIFTDALKDYVLLDIMKQDVFTSLKESVKQELIKLLTPEDLKKNHTFNNTLQVMIGDAVKANKQSVDNIISNNIRAEGFKEKVASHIAAIVENRVKLALGEVCEGCDRDYY